MASKDLDDLHLEGTGGLVIALILLPFVWHGSGSPRFLEFSRGVENNWPPLPHNHKHLKAGPDEILNILRVKWNLGSGDRIEMIWERRLCWGGCKPGDALAVTSYSQFEITEIVALRAESSEIKRTLPKCLPLPIAIKGAPQILIPENE